MKVLLAYTSLDASHGGPPIVVARLAEALSNAGATVALLTADDTGSRPSPLKVPGVRYFSGGIATAIEEFGRPDIIHDHSLWIPSHRAITNFASLLRIPLVVSPAGCLQPQALRIKAFKKRVAWLVYQRRSLNKAQLIHATSQLELDAIRLLGLTPPVTLIPHGIDLPDPIAKATEAKRTALFLGRIHPVKGLPMLIAAWARVMPENWLLRIVGPDEDRHQAVVEQAVRRARLENTVSFHGPVAGTAKATSFQDADLFVLPSYTENFGVAAAEALAAGLPVITTTVTPWHELDSRGCGWCTAPDETSLASALSRATALPATVLSEMGRKGREWMAADFSWDRITERYLDAYAGLLRGRA
jgi:glycosyltransferase involved in cell wall biosynthesis